MKGMKVVVLNLGESIIKKLDEYGFDYQRNLETWCYDVWREIIECEVKTKEEDE